MEEERQSSSQARLGSSAAELLDLLGRAGPVWVGLGVAAGLLRAGALVLQASVLAQVSAAALGHHLSEGTIDSVVSKLAVVALVLGTAGAIGELSGERAARSARASLRRDGLSAAGVLLATQRAPRLEADDGGIGALSTELTVGVDGIDAFVGRYLPRAVLALAVPLGLLAWIAHLDLLSAGLATLALVAMPVLAALAGLGTARAVRERLAALERLGERFVNLVGGLPLLIAYGRAEAQEAVVADAGQRTRTTTMATLRLALLSGLVLEVLAAVGTALVAVPLGLRLDSGKAILPQAIAILVLTPEVYLPVRTLAADFHAGASGRQVASGIRRLVLEAGSAQAQRSESPASPMPPQPSRPEGARVVIGGARVRYPGRDRPALVDVDLDLAPGERVGLLGPSGSGKTSLLRLAAGLLQPEAGSVLVDGLPPSDPARPPIAWVPEHPSVLGRTLLENVALGRREVDVARARWALSSVGLDALSSGPSGGLQVPLGEGGRRLSMGERRRLAIARALAGDPPRLWLVDEPTEGLDPEAASAVLCALSSATRHSSLLLATHDRRALCLVDRVVDVRAFVPAAARAADSLALGLR